MQLLYFKLLINMPTYRLNLFFIDRWNEVIQPLSKDYIFKCNNSLCHDQEQKFYGHIHNFLITRELDSTILKLLLKQKSYT